MTTILICALICGLGLACFGALDVFGQGMSSSPSTGDMPGGCIAVIAEVAVFVGSVIALIVRAF